MFRHLIRIFVLSFFIAQLSCWIRVENFKCSSSNKTVSSNYSCFVKRYGPRNSSINAEFFVPNAVNFLWVSAFQVCRQRAL
jgi:hypothetical protein